MLKYIKTVTILMLALSLSWGQKNKKSRLISTVIMQQKQLFIDEPTIDDSTLYAVSIGSNTVSEQQNVLLKRALKDIRTRLETDVWQKLGYSEYDSEQLARVTSLPVLQLPNLDSIKWYVVSDSKTQNSTDAASTTIRIELQDTPLLFSGHNDGRLIVTEAPESFSVTLDFKVMQPSVSLKVAPSKTDKTKGTTLTDEDHLLGYFTSIEIADIKAAGRATSSKDLTNPYYPRQSRRVSKRIDYGNGGVGLDIGWWRDHPRLAPTVQATRIYANISRRNALQFFGFIDGSFHMSVGANPDTKKFVLDIPSNAAYGLGIGYSIFSLGFIGQESYYNFSTDEFHNEGLFRGGFSFGLFVPFKEKRGILIQPIAGWYASKNRMFGIFKAPETDKINNFGGHIELILTKKRISLDYSRVIAHHLENQADGIGHIIQGRYNHVLKNDDIITLSVKSNTWISDLRDSNVDFYVSYIKGIF